MKILSLIALFSSFVAVLSGQPVDVPSSIDSVTVYQGMAKVTRTFEVDLAAGQKTTLRFSGLPANLDSSLVQVSVADGAALDLGLVGSVSEFKDADRSQVLKNLEAALLELKARAASLQQARKMANDNVQGLQNIVASINAGIGETGNKELYELALAALSESQKAAAEAFDKVTAIDEQLRLLAVDMKTAKDAFDKQLARETATCTKYSVEVVSAGGKSAGLISYYVGGPSWSPTYIVKADTVKGTLGVEYQAVVAQNCGEDWTNVKMSLETSRPGRGAKPVEPPAIVLQQVQPYRAAASYSKSIAFEESLDYSGAPPPAMFANSVQVASSSVGFSAQIKDRVTVLSSDNSTVLSMMKRDMPCEFHTETVPLTAESAFLIGKFKSAFPLPLLEGRMQAIVDGSTNGSGVVDLTLPGDEISVGLGVNQNVLVTRKVIAEKGKDSGIFGSKRVEERQYVNTITNRMSVAQRIVVRDRVPLTKDDKIEVKLIEPSKATPDTETGIFDQEVTLKPGQSIELPTRFRVAYPSDWQINGGF
jgi:uncharacterized protein (TIGR02231 family)